MKNIIDTELLHKILDDVVVQINETISSITLGGNDKFNGEYISNIRKLLEIEEQLKRLQNISSELKEI